MTNLDEDEEADIEAQLYMMGNLKHQTIQHPDIAKRVKEIENRQKIFEDEIIKRIKEN